LPDTLIVPVDVRAQAFTATPHWYAIITTDDRILIYNRSDGLLRQEIIILPE
jgi:hypothetical protein